MAGRRLTVVTALFGVLGLLIATLVALAAGPAAATFPGKNGLIAFNRGGNIYTATATGGSVRQLTTSGGLSGARWSPDGKRLAYKDSAGTVYVRTLATGRTVTLGTGANAAPVWSPDGARVAWSLYNPDPDDYQIYPVLVDVAPATGGTAATVLTKFHDEGYPYENWYLVTGWSLDGTRLLVNFGGGCCGGSYYFNSASEFVIATSSFASPVVASAVCQDTDPCNASLSGPTYGPGGNGVLFSGISGQLPGSSNAASETEKIYAVNRSGAGLHRVSTASSASEPTWSPSGAMVVFTQTATSGTNLMKVTGTSSTAKATVLIRNASQADWQPVA